MGAATGRLEGGLPGAADLRGGKHAVDRAPTDDCNDRGTEVAERRSLNHP
jgi:hypothetical protein